MTIGIDAGMLGVTDERLKVGVYRVVQHLLLEIAKCDTTNSYRLYSFFPIDQAVMGRFGPHMTNVVLTPPYGYMRVRLPIELSRHTVDIFLGLGGALPPFTRVASLGFVYDLGFLYSPDAYGSSFLRLRKQTADLVKRATHIVAISNTTKRDIFAHYKRNDSDITVAYPGVDKNFTLQGKRVSRPRGYFLFVGSLTKTKDVPLLIRSFARFAKKYRDVDLLLAGGDLWPDPRIDVSIHRYNLRDRVIRLGYVSDDALPTYYRGATAFVTTALHEGFCLPVVEAMACGTPVIVVNRGALSEIVGDGGLVVPAHEEAISHAMVDIVSNQKLRNDCTRRGSLRSSTFTWVSFAKTILSLIT